MYYTRKIDSFLEEWLKMPSRLPLIVRGARQVGKTASVMQFAERHYEHVVSVNFVTEPRYRQIIEYGYSPASIIKHITRIDPSQTFVPGKTLVFFDEVQACPDVTTSLKFFKLDGRYDVICSGSQLGIQYQRIESCSVGYKLDYTMRSLDFEEYLWSLGYPKELADDMLSHLWSLTPFSQGEMATYTGHFMDYLLLGGMPAVVADFHESGTFSRTGLLQQQLLLDYQEDIQKYAEGLDKARILEVFNQIAPQLAKENKKFLWSRLGRNARAKDYAGCVEWLLDAGVISICHGLNAPELPLKGNYDPSRFKLYMADTSMLLAMLDEEDRQDFRQNRNLGIYKGALYENILAEALTKGGYDLYYYRREDSSLEQDFFVRTAQELLPVEVKAGNNTAKSMRTLIASPAYPAIRHGLKFAMANLGQQNEITTLPLFTAFLLKRYLAGR